MKRSILGLILLAVFGAAAAAQVLPGPQVDSDEVVRRGNHVAYIDGFGDDKPDPIAEALAPPADDSHKWYITVLTTKGCQACEILKRDFEEHPDLRAFVNVKDYKQSWSHFNFYSMDDATQNWRFKPPKSDLAIKGFPTLIVQPPFNGRYGKSSTIVMQKTGYDGDARKLARQMSHAIKTYVAKVTTKSVMRMGERRGEFPVSALRGQGEDPYAEDRRWPEKAWGQRTPPFPRPDDGQNTPAPSPDLPPLVIPGPLDPDGPPQPDQKPDDNKLPEAILVVDSANEQPAIEAQARRFLDRLRNERKPLAVRIVDFAFATNLPVKRDETPAVVVRDGDRTSVVTGRLLPLLSPPEIAPAPTAAVTIADLPWESLLMLVTGTGGIGAAVPLVIFGIRWFRSRRQQAGKPTLLNDATLAQLLLLLQQVDFEKLLAQFRKAPASA
jgi:hypothetical protein